MDFALINNEEVEYNVIFSSNLTSNTAQVSNWLNKQKEVDSCWIVIHRWDEDNTLTHLFWITPDQALLADKSLESHVWIFNQLLKSTSTFPAIILTNTNPAIDAAVHQYCTIEDSSEQFLVAAKYMQVQEIVYGKVAVPYLYFFNQQSKDFCKKRQTILEQKISYRKIYGIYKKALQTALQNKKRDNNDDECIDLEEFLDDTDNNKENSEPKIVYLQNSKCRHGRGCPL
ncbi:21070_t:CDS:2, partial [Gigaspora rosea]